MHTSHGYTYRKDEVVKRLKRAEGQVRGVTRLVENDTYCIDIITQISAVKAALDKVALELLRDHSNHCLQPEDSDKKKAKKADELVKAVERLL